jgi:hypothetical protein
MQCSVSVCYVTDQIQILLFSLVAFKIPTKNYLFFLGTKGSPHEIVFQSVIVSAFAEVSLCKLPGEPTVSIGTVTFSYGFESGSKFCLFFSGFLDANKK